MNTDHANSSEETQALMLRYLDGDLSNEEIDTLNQRLKDDLYSRRAVACLLIQELHLVEIGQAAKASALASDQPSTVRQVVRWPHWAVRWLLGECPSRIAWLGGLAVLTTVLGLVVSNARFSAGSPRLLEVRGVVTHERDHRKSHLSAEEELKVGDELTFPPGASATIRYRLEATTIRLADSAQFRLESVRKGKIILLHRGLLIGVVSRQPRYTPLKIVTPLAEATVLGTEFALSSRSDATRLEVLSGTVRLKRTSDGASTDVKKEQFAVAADGVELVSKSSHRGLLWEYWLGVRGPSVTDLASDPRFPAEPSGKDYLSRFETPTNWADNYGARARGYLRPAVAGTYTFWIAGDDAAELWLSPDENPENKVKICWTETWTRPGEWDKHPQQKSAPVVLEAGRRYYVEARHQEAGGGDCLAVAWKAPGREREIIPGGCLTPPDDAQHLARSEPQLFNPH